MHRAAGQMGAGGHTHGTSDPGGASVRVGLGGVGTWLVRRIGPWPSLLRTRGHWEEALREGGASGPGRTMSTYCILGVRRPGRGALAFAGLRGQKNKLF